MADQAFDPIAAAATDLARRHDLSGFARTASPVAAWSQIGKVSPWLGRAMAHAAGAEGRTGPAAEWLLDNDYVVRRAALEIGKDLPRGFYARLPALESERPVPRVYALAHALLDHSRMQIALGPMVRYVNAYQELMPLSIAELWALPTMLRLACVELLVSAVERIFPDISPPFDPGYAQDLCRGSDATECIARAIANLTVIATIQWKDFFDRASRVEAILRAEPAGVYANMDFETRDQYRRAVETLADRVALKDWDVAARAIAQCRPDQATASDHVGYWLVGPGRAVFEDSIESRPFAIEALARRLLRNGPVLYAAALLLAGLAGLAVPSFYLAAHGATAAQWLLGLALSALPASVLSVTLVNWAVTRLVPPCVLPKLDFTKGISADCATAVVMPVIIGQPSDVRPLIDRLEGHYLGNPDRMVLFALLSDFVDAPREVMPQDAAIATALRDGIAALNARHGEHFALLHRARRHNARQGCWMGWERKRGKLEQFNRFLLDGDASAFPITAGPVAALASARFVVTADADTRLPPGTVSRLAATLAHPLNQARFDQETGRVTAGYTVLQPRIEIAPDIAERSLFIRIFGGDTAIDIYSRAVSDVYQDLIGTGIFVGKGIYDVAAFTPSLEGRIPENLILSHDLFEGLHGRAGLVSDIILFEGFPRGYLDHLHRLHRWIRGDWQIAYWLLPYVPGPDGTWLRNRLGWFDRLKIFDNLRRSMIPVSILLLLFAGWFLLPGAPLVWTVLAVLAPGAGLFTDLVTGLAQGRRRGVLQSFGRRFADHGARWLLALAFLISDSALSVRAIGITLWRLGAHSHLLEWTSAAHVSEHFAARDPRRAAWSEMWTSPVIAILATLDLGLIRPAALPVATPLLLLWLLAPEIAVLVGRSRPLPVETLDEADRIYLRKIARRTWLYFETFLRPEDNWLPPDNYQEPPDEAIAHRTSPTNVGVTLLAALTAWRLGHIGLGELVVRLRNTLDALDRLQRYRGHMLNWYDSRTLEPLEPRYISTVDSGNLAVSLVVVAAALREARGASAFSDKAWAGLIDELRLLGDALGPNNAIDAMIATATEAAEEAAPPRQQLDKLRLRDLPVLRAIVHQAVTAEALSAGQLREAQLWLERIDHHLRAMQRDLELLLPLDEAIDVPLDRQLVEIADRAAEWAHRMEFGFLFDADSRLFHIGYNLSADHIDQHHYDLLASEARLASFFAIAKGDVPFEHWFHLGRPITKREDALALVSWNGSMFEYLMPNLFLRSDPETLLGRSDRSAVDLQRAYGRAHDLPWGISESAYGEMGHDRAWRYHAFGVPGLGLRRGLERDMVIAPYASALALAARPRAAVRNLKRLAALGMIGRYGFREAIDFTPSRLAEGQKSLIVRSYMVHHHGMSLAAIGNALCDDMLVRWFHADPHVRTVDLLLNERVPWELPPELERNAAREAPMVPTVAIPALHGWQAASLDDHCLHVTGNGRLTSAWGTRHMRLTWNGIEIARTDDGPWLHVRDCTEGARLDSSPVSVADLHLNSHLVESHQRTANISITTQIGVVHGDDLEIRRVTLVNDSDRPRIIDLANYAEVVLAPPREAARHPAFSKLFVQSRPLGALEGLIFTRRPRGQGQHPPVLLHRLVGDDEGFDWQGFESDRATLLGRHGDPADPAALRLEHLGDGAGWTLDPAMALKARLTIPPFGRREMAFLSIVAASESTALEIAERYSTLAALEWALADAAAHAQRTMHQIGLSPDATVDAHRLMAALIGPDTHRSPAAFNLGDSGARGALWSLGISGDDPILVLRDQGEDKGQLLDFLIPAQKLWRLRGLSVDIAVLHDGQAGYIEPARDRLLDKLRNSGAQPFLGIRGGIHLVGKSQADPVAIDVLRGASRHLFSEGAGSILEQMSRTAPVRPPSPRFIPIGTTPTSDTVRPVVRRDDLLCDNGIGGFAPESRAYVIHLEPGETTPAPWANVLANEDFGTIVTEAGLGFSWSVNAGENRLTPWSNDPVRDPQGEILYLRDEDNGHVWTVTPLPLGQASACEIRHGAGLTIWQRNAEGLEQTLTTFVAPNAPVKLVRLRLANPLPRARRISAIFYADWLLGTNKTEAAPLRRAEHDPESGAALAWNRWADPFRTRVAFVAASLAPSSLTVSRTAFLGPKGDVAAPEALVSLGLGECRQAIGDDCCAALQIEIEVPAEDSVELHFLVGQGDDRDHARQIIARYRDPEAVTQALRKVQQDWDMLLGTVTVVTPDRDFDLLVNRWLPYQAISARIRARAGFYQAGGAFGFRDQLQDVLALLVSDPGRARRHILEAARFQFGEGDVLHWWHPPTGAGVRTHCSDDLLWLPYATAAYVEATGDDAILAEPVPFLRAPPLDPGEADRYAAFPATDEHEPLFEHLHRALDHGYRLGAHGLPLIGSGDWNDGMDRVGDEGRGESVWLGWFMIDAIHGFTRLCDRSGRGDLSGFWRGRAARLAQAIEANAWDGEWYVRAFDDDGRAWGTAAEMECRIDSIAQSWAQISGAGAPDRVAAALRSAQSWLVRADDRLVRLLDPPFDASPRDPGYIKAYPPGIRENGGQYTHAAAWLGIALARAGDGGGSMEVFRRINPIRQSATAAEARRFRTEPYVLAADVAGTPPHVGRGGWSWYTGAAAWTWRLAVEELLGLRLVDGKLSVRPCLPPDWRRFEAIVRRGGHTIHVRYENPEGISNGGLELYVDGHRWEEASVPFPTDGGVIRLDVRMRQKDKGDG